MNSNILFNPKIKQEFLDRFDELKEQQDARDTSALRETSALDVALESQFVTQPYRTTRLTVDDARNAVESIQEGRSGHVDAELEAIIIKFGRPAYFVKDNSYSTASAPSSSTEVNETVNRAKGVLEKRIPSVGRINVRNHIKPWEGTGWIVAPGVVVTNRHVASGFSQREGDGFELIETGGYQVKPELDMKSEYQSDDEVVFRMKRVLWIEPPSSPYDVAFISIEPESISIDRDPLPGPIPLIDQDKYDKIQIHDWGAVVGYPALSPYNNAQDQQRIFQGVFDVKRLQPGLVTAKMPDGTVLHDASTLGGNSGSVFLDLGTGAAIALHWGGIEGKNNSAIAAPIVQRILSEKVLNVT